MSLPTITSKRNRADERLSRKAISAPRIAYVTRHRLDQASAAIGLPGQQNIANGGDLPAREIGLHATQLDRPKRPCTLVAFCHGGFALWILSSTIKSYRGTPNPPCFFYGLLVTHPGRVKLTAEPISKTKAPGGRPMVEIPNDFLAKLIAAVITIEKKYAHELTGVRNDRRDEIKAEINRRVAEHLDK